MFYSCTLAALITLPVMAATAAAPPAKAASVASTAGITLERTGCKTDCPVYRISVTANGSVAFDGIANVRHKGHAGGKVAADVPGQLIAYARKIHFFSMKSGYATKEDGCIVVDDGMSSAIVTITLGSKRKSVHHYLGCEGLEEVELLDRLENFIDNRLGSAQWVGRIYQGED